MRAVCALLLFATHDAAALLRPQVSESRSLSSAETVLTLDLSPAHTAAPLRKVSPAFISFALDNAFVRTDCRPINPTSNKHGNATCLPDDATNSTRIDFQDKLLKKIMPLTAGGYIRIGGTYTDFVHYQVEGTNYTRCPFKNMTSAGQECPGNSFPCCLPMPVARWREALQFGHDIGMQITFNLNILHGRWDDYTAAIKCRREKNCPPLPPSGYRPRWDSSNARALMEFTKTLPTELWPARFGLGNELNWYIPPQQWAEDMIEMSTMIKEVFGATSSIKTYGPCNAGLLGTWSNEFLGNISTRGPSALGAFSFHGYQHSGPISSNIAQFPGIDASREFFESVYVQDWHNGSAAPNKDAELWITETAWTAQAPSNSAAGGPQAVLNGMECAADMAWNLDALGAAAEVGVDVFCRETLAGDWLEVLGLWQPRDQQPYTPHADFIVAAMWRKLMDAKVLGAANTTTAVITRAASQPAPLARDHDGEGWKIFPGFSSYYRKGPLNGSALFPFLGLVDSVAGCEAKCAAWKGCQSWSWDSSKPGTGAPGWGHRCFGQTNEQFHLDPVGGVTAGCHPSSLHCKMPPPPPPGPTAIRPYAHCSRATPGSVVFAISAAPCVRSPNERITLRFPGAQSLTSYWLSARAITSNIVALNGQNLTFTADGPLPSLEGAASSGDSVVMPSGGVCTVGFVEVKYAKPVPACKSDDTASAFTHPGGWDVGAPGLGTLLYFGMPRPVGLNFDQTPQVCLKMDDGVAAAPAPAPIKYGLPWPQGTGQGHDDENWPLKLMSAGGGITDALLARYKALGRMKPSIRRYNMFWSSFETVPAQTTRFKCPAGSTAVPASEAERVELGYAHFHCYGTEQLKNFDTLLLLDSQIGAQGAAILYSAPPWFRQKDCKGFIFGKDRIMGGCAPRDDAMADYEDYVLMLALRYGKSLRHYVVWNEVASAAWMDMSGGPHNCPNSLLTNGTNPLTPECFDIWVSKYATLMQCTANALHTAGLADAAVVWSSNDHVWDPPKTGAIGGRLHVGVKPFHDALWPKLAHVNFSFAMAVHPYDGGNPMMSRAMDGQHRTYNFATLDHVHNYVAGQVQKYLGLAPGSAAARPYLIQFASEQGWPFPACCDDRIRSRNICYAQALLAVGETVILLISPLHHC